MRPSLRRLLDHPIDYAGLFPPAQFSMKVAVDDYLQVLGSEDAWIVDKFVCPAVKLEELSKALECETVGPIRVTVVGSQSPDSPLVAVKHDAEIIIRCNRSHQLKVESYETKVPQGEGLAGAVNAAKRLTSLIEDDIDVYLEVGWGDGMVDAMHDAAAYFEEAGFKARTGGTTAEAFPSTVDLAAFISECSALESPFKFTAGLHQPMRHFDEELKVHRHGFLNAMLAGALACNQDLSRREIQTILEIEDHTMFSFGVDDIRVGEHWLEAEQIETFWAMFGGFGSCSIDEPIEGLKQLKLLQEVGA